MFVLASPKVVGLTYVFDGPGFFVYYAVDSRFGRRLPLARSALLDEIQFRNESSPFQNAVLFFGLGSQEAKSDC